MSEEGETKRGIMGKILPKAKPPKEDLTNNMSFLDHLEELRWRILKGLVGVLFGVIVAFFYRDFIIQQFILGPARADFFMYQIMPINAIDLSLISRRLPNFEKTTRSVFYLLGNLDYYRNHYWISDLNLPTLGFC